ncbi:hypothetical protein B0H16DRAFT_1554870 [Mycena metata]|uniref:Uncharacterized protein n=1 Tax=Mycena metata TaxID=1033252 RepID=A0AAD7IR78_9AGAR|nr:hypothetical protein B0H16DRAFT_1554870 [Mycena metata]
MHPSQILTLLCNYTAAARFLGLRFIRIHGDLPNIIRAEIHGLKYIGASLGSFTLGILRDSNGRGWVVNRGRHDSQNRCEYYLYDCNEFHFAVRYQRSALTMEATRKKS